MKELTYEQAMKRVEQIVYELEKGEIDLDHLLLTMEEANRLLTFCKDKLLKVEQEIANSSEKQL